MEIRNQLLYFLGWPWGTAQGVRIDGELSEDYPALVVRGQGACVVSLAQELEDAVEAVDEWLYPEADGRALAAFLFDEDAPVTVETAHMLIPGPGGPRFAPQKGTVRFDPPRAQVEAFAAGLPETDWLRGGLAPYARACAVYDGGEIAALAGGRLLGGVLDMSYVTRPDKRGQGWGAAALSAMMTAYPQALPLWRAEETNTASLRAAQRMGFVPYFLQEGLMLKDDF